MMMGRRVTSISPANCQGFTLSFKPPAPVNASPSLNPLKTSREVDKRTRESKGGKRNVRESSTSNIGWINKDIREMVFLIKTDHGVPICSNSTCIDVFLRDSISILFQDVFRFPNLGKIFGYHVQLGNWWVHWLSHGSSLGTPSFHVSPARSWDLTKHLAVWDLGGPSDRKRESVA